MTKENKIHQPPAVTVDIVIFTIENNELRVLLIKRANEPFKGEPALPGGFLLKGETTQDAAMRILKEKAGVKDVYVEQLYTFDNPGRDPRGHVITVAYVALIPPEQIRFEDGEKAQSPAFYSVKKLPKLAFDHRNIAEYAVTRLQAKLEYTNIAFSLLPRQFVFAELQKLYEAVLGREIDKRNFRKKFMSLGLIKSTGKKLRGARQRPAELYRFASKKRIELRKFF